MQKLMLSILGSGLAMAILDGLWLNVVAKKFYRNQLGSIFSKQFNLAAAAIFYVIYLAGVIVFVISPALDNGSWAQAGGYGALFGLVAYATYDLTNLATLKDFTLRIVVVDLAWGTFLTSVVALAGYAMAVS